MLQDFRDKLRGTTAFILVAILIVPFAFWGVESLFVAGGSSETAATVNGRKIAELDVSRGIEMQRQSLLNRFGDIDPAMLSDDRLRRPVIDQLVRGALLTDTAQEQGMAISHDTFNELILDNEAFKAAHGGFDRGQYEYQLARLGFTPLEYRKVVMDELLANQFTLGLQMSVIVPEPQKQAFSRILLQERSFSYLTLPLSQFAEQVEISEESIASYYESNSDKFRVPDKVVMEYIELTPEVVEKFVEIDEEVLRSRFEAAQQSVDASASSWNLAHILIEHKDDNSHQALIAELEKKITAGNDFADLAREYSVDFGSAESGGELGSFTRESLPEGFAAALETLAAGEVSGPVETVSGTHFIKVIDKTEADALVFEDERPRLEEEYRREQASEKLAIYLEKLKEETFNVDSLAYAADSLGLPVAISKPFPESGGEGIARYPQVLQAAFDEEVLEHGYASEVLDLGEQHYIVIKLKESQPAHLAPLDVVHESIKNTLEITAAEELAKAAADDLLGRLNEGQTLEQIAAEEEREVETVEGATRFDVRSAPELAAEVFRHSAAGLLPIHGQVKTAEQYFVYSLTAITQVAQDRLSAEEARALYQSLAQQQAGREFQAYVESLESGAKIKVR